MRNLSYLLLAIAAGLAVSCGGGHHEARHVEELPTVTVSTTTVEAAEWPSVYEAVGTVEARTATTISAKVMGYVKEVTVDAGDRVRSGQRLVTLDARDLDAGYRRAQAGLAEAQSAMAEVENAILAAEAQMELAQATFNRMKGLYDKTSITEQEFDEASAKLRMAQANHKMALSKKDQLGKRIQQAEEAVTSAEIMKGYSEITAPFAGVVTAKIVEPGNLAAPGAPLLTIERGGSYRLEAQVEESRLGDIRVGQEVEVHLDAVGEPMSARVSEIVPAVEASSRAFTVRINLPASANLRSGLFGRARFAGGGRQVVAIPGEAVVQRGQVRSVYVVTDGHARGRLVTLGGSRGATHEVLSGLTAGERVVAPVPADLVDGSPVEVRP